MPRVIPAKKVLVKAARIQTTRKPIAPLPRTKQILRERDIYKNYYLNLVRGNAGRILTPPGSPEIFAVMDGAEVEFTVADYEIKSLALVLCSLDYTYKGFVSMLRNWITYKNEFKSKRGHYPNPDNMGVLFGKIVNWDFDQ